MKRVVPILLAGILVGVLALWWAGPSARSTAGETAPGFIYSVQYLCNKVGQHGTTIMVHNFGGGNEPVQWKVSQGNAFYLLDSDPGPISPFATRNLTANQSGFIDCDAIRDRFGGFSLFIPQGFVEIASPVELSVIATYYREGADGNITMDVEQYKPFAGQLPRR